MLHQNQNGGWEIIANTKPNKEDIPELPFYCICHMKSLPTESQDWENIVMQKHDNSTFSFTGVLRSKKLSKTIHSNSTLSHSLLLDLQDTNSEDPTQSFLTLWKHRCKWNMDYIELSI